VTCGEAIALQIIAMSERENSEKNLHKAIVILGKIPELPLLQVEDIWLNSLMSLNH
jgi:hypothetical protein